MKIIFGIMLSTLIFLGIVFNTYQLINVLLTKNGYAKRFIFTSFLAIFVSQIILLYTMIFLKDLMLIGIVIFILGIPSIYLYFKEMFN